MKTKRVVEASQVHLSQWFSMGMSGVSFLAGIFLLIANPQFSDPQRDLEIYDQGVSRVTVTLPPDTTSRNIGFLLLVIGFLSGSLAVALAGEDALDHPTSLTPLEAPGKTVFPEETKALPLEVIEKTTDRLQILLETVPWLASCIMSPSVIIVGGTGSGKSRLAMCISLMQCIMQKGTLRIGDLDAFQNLVKKTWIAGKVWGDKEADAPALPEVTNGQVESILKLIGIACGGQRSEASPWETYIWDELIKWLTDPTLSEQLQHLIKFGVATTRKRNQSFIYLAHGLEKGMFGGESNASGTLSALLEVSPVIYLPTRKNVWGKALKEDYFFYKPAGVRIKSDEPPTRSSHGRWEILGFPDQLDPTKLGEALRPLFDPLGLTLETEEDRRGQVDQVAKRVFREEIKQEFPTFSELESLEGGEESDEEGSRGAVALLDHSFALASDNAIPVEHLSELALKLYRASNGRYATGSHPINSVFSNWKKQGGFAGAGGKKDFMTFLSNTPGIIVQGTEFYFNVIQIEA